MTPSELVRKVLLLPGWRPLGAEALESLAALRVQLRLAGNNLNQLTRQVHLVGLGERARPGLGADLEAAIGKVATAASAVTDLASGVRLEDEAGDGRRRR